MPDTLPYEGTHIVIFYDRVQAAIAPGRVTTLLAHVMAHEVTHMLEGIPRHSAEGVLTVHQRRLLPDVLETAHPGAYRANPYESETILRDFRRYRRLSLFARRHLPQELVGEVVEKDHLAFCLLIFLLLDWHERGEALAVWSDIQILTRHSFRKPLLGPKPRPAGQERISLRREGHHHYLLL
jgi:hypothetical protein